MCGIHAFISGSIKQTNADDFIRQGFIAGSLRGDDASGIVSIDVDRKDMGWQKLPISGPMFITERYARMLIGEANGKNTITVGHTRSITSGASGLNEAHPFVVQDNGRELVGVHNGTLTNWKYKSEAKHYSVDSEWALNHIFLKGKEAFKDFSGSYCFVWWDSANSECLNIALNDERSLYFAHTDNDGVAFASEAGMLHWLCERNRIKLIGDIFKLNSNKWYKFNVTDLKNYTSEELPVPATPTKKTTCRQSYKTTVERIDDLLALIGKRPASQPSTALVTVGEIREARKLNIIGTEGTFAPTYLDTELGELVGTFITDMGIEAGAIIRQAHHLVFDADTSWPVKCIGAQDNGFELVVICHQPVTKLVAANDLIH